MYNVTCTHTALKALTKIEAELAQTIRAKINQYDTNQPLAAVNVKQLKRSKVRRMRVGDYRLLFTITLSPRTNGVMLILDVRQGRQAYWGIGTNAMTDSNIQIIRTPAGEELVILPRPDFDRLVAAAADRADAERGNAVLQALAAGRDEAVPAEILDRLLSGENKLRVWRTYRGVTVAELAEATGRSVSYFSLIETGRKPGSLDVFRKAATVLRVEIDDLV